MVNELHNIKAVHEDYGFIKEVLNYYKKRTKYTKNEIRIYENGICEIDTYDSFGKYKNTATFSEIDLELVKQHKWYVDNSGYLSTTINGKKVRLHKLLYPNDFIDHYDNNKLNNTRENLQITNHNINIAKIPHKMYNKTGITGLYKTPNHSWQASIEVNKRRQTKTFKTKEEAILMRYIWELNFWNINAPQLKEIQELYPHLVKAMYKGYKISENPKLVLAILKKLSQDEHCPCKLIKNEDTKCMCKEFQEQEKGICHCGLFVKEA